MLATPLRGDVIFSVNDISKTTPEIHPVKPWIACAVDETSSVCIWDYEKKIKICEFSVNQYEDEKNEAYQMQKLLEKDPQYKGPRAGPPSKTEKLGQIKALKFFDREARVWKSITARTVGEKESLYAKEGGGATPSFVDTSNPFMDNILIIAAENRVIMFDYVSHKFQDVKGVDGKLLQCIEIFGLSPLVAFGGSDGVVRIYDFEKGDVIKHLLSGHTKNVVGLFGYLEGDNLISAGADGSTCLWNVKTGILTKQFPKNQEFAGSSYSAHSGYFVTFGADKIVMWDLASLREAQRISTTKYILGGVEHFPHPYSSQYMLVFRKDRSQISVIDAAKASIAKEDMIEVIDLNLHLNTSNKNECKIFSISVHPLSPQYIACSTNKGTCIVRVGFALTPSVFLSRTEEGVIYYFSQLNVSTLNLATFRTASVGKLTGPSVAADIALSGSGKHVSALWPDLGRYQIYETGSWKSIEEGSAKALAWSSYGAHFAVLDIVNEVVTDKRKKTRKDTADKVVGKRVLRLGLPAGEKRDLPVPSLQSVVGVISGPLLGVQSYTGDQQPPPMSAVTLQWYDWATGQPIGPSFASPRSIITDPTQEFCVLVYDTWFSVHSLLPFKFICKCQHTLLSATWASRSLIYTTPTEIRIMFPHPEETNPVTIFSFSLIPSVPVLALAKTPENIIYRPFGCIAVVAVQGFSLVVADTTFKTFYTLPLDNPYIQFLLHVQGGSIEIAMNLTKQINHKYHTHMARFLQTRGFADEVLQLQGCPNELKFIVASQAKLSEGGNIQLTGNTIKPPAELANTYVELGKLAIQSSNAYRISTSFANASTQFTRATEEFKQALPPADQGEAESYEALWKKKLEFLSSLSS